MSQRKFSVVVGGSGALGGAVLELLCHHSDTELVATYCNTSPPEELGDKVQWIHYDSESMQGLDALYDAIKDGVVTHLLFAAGKPSSKRAIDTAREEWEQLWRSNVIGFVDVYRGLHQALRMGEARVLVVSSDTTRKLGVKNGPYSATKAALEAVAITLAREEAPYGVRINVMAPSLFESPLAEKVMRLKGITDLHAYMASLPWKRPLTLSEVANVAVSILTSEEWRYASGQIYRLAAEGGHLSQGYPDTAD
jgi:NAD(P)-dependent dehydrogenase (short-subunit alcohol dehydrogenase family)